MHAVAIVSGTDRTQRLASSFPTALLATVFYAHVSALFYSNQEFANGLENHYSDCSMRWMRS
ncbi:hypothetical protein C482_15443 [Natrialba chahannaoensis JCM 10990]|uniref:Uncharacterized protein n=1 Tax=Natrialba chahannaoensis JCM 10990 TaxID=1227492 RepID=M0AD15_9EURY|nr:hypothetical protein C482_15443 [Natrialba chahannaoensis JCM 10990]